MKSLLNAVSYSKLGVSRKPIKQRTMLLTLVFIIAVFSIGTILVTSGYDVLPEWTNTTSTTEEYEQKLLEQQTKYSDKRTIIFPNNFELNDRKLVNFYIKDLELALDPQDLIYRNRFTYKIPNGIPYKPYDVELFDSGTASSNLDQCLELSSNIKVEASPAYNKNSNLTKILQRFVDENSLYYQEVKVFFPELPTQLKEGTISDHWYQLIGSSVWLKQYGIHLMISRIVYTDTDQGYGVISLSYLQVFDRDWNELDHVELMIRKEDGTYKPVQYPQFAPIPLYYNAKVKIGQFYGIEDPRIQVIINKNGDEEPIIIYNSPHRKIKETEAQNDGKSVVKYGKYRSIFLGWLWRTQKGKNNLEELPDKKMHSMEYIKIKEMIRPNNERRGTEKNWGLFLDYEMRKEKGFDTHLYFIYQFKDTKILKCSLYDEDNCEWEYEVNDYMGSGSFHGGTELVSINRILDEHKLPELDDLKLRIPEGRQIWIGFARAVLKECGCGTHLYRPNLIVFMKDKREYKFSYVSSFNDFGIEVLEWWIGQGLCTAKNLIIPNGISSWNIEKEKDGSLMDYMTFTITRRDATVDLVHLKGILRSLLFENSNPKLLAHEQKGFRTNTNLDCALRRSDEYCKVYAAEVEAKETFENKNKEGENKKDD